MMSMVMLFLVGLLAAPAQGAESLLALSKGLKALEESSVGERWFDHVFTSKEVGGEILAAVLLDTPNVDICSFIVREFSGEIVAKIYGLAKEQWSLRSTLREVIFPRHENGSERLVFAAGYEEILLCYKRSTEGTMVPFVYDTVTGKGHELQGIVGDINNYIMYETYNQIFCQASPSGSKVVRWKYESSRWNKSYDVQYRRVTTSDKGLGDVKINDLWPRLVTTPCIFVSECSGADACSYHVASFGDKGEQVNLFSLERCSFFAPSFYHSGLIAYNVADSLKEDMRRAVFIVSSVSSKAKRILDVMDQPRSGAWRRRGTPLLAVVRRDQCVLCDVEAEKVVKRLFFEHNFSCLNVSFGYNLIGLFFESKGAQKSERMFGVKKLMPDELA